MWLSAAINLPDNKKNSLVQPYAQINNRIQDVHRKSTKEAPIMTREQATAFIFEGVQNDMSEV